MYSYTYMQELSRYIIYTGVKEAENIYPTRQQQNLINREIWMGGDDQETINNIMQ